MLKTLGVLEFVAGPADEPGHEGVYAMLLIYPETMIKSL